MKCNKEIKSNIYWEWNISFVLITIPIIMLLLEKEIEWSIRFHISWISEMNTYFLSCINRFGSYTEKHITLEHFHLDSRTLYIIHDLWCHVGNDSLWISHYFENTNNLGTRYVVSSHWIVCYSVVARHYQVVAGLLP